MLARLKFLPCKKLGGVFHPLTRRERVVLEYKSYRKINFMTTNERGPRSYVERAVEKISDFDKNSNEIKGFLALCQQLKKIADLDTKLEAVLGVLTEQYTDPRASDDMRGQVKSMLGELDAYVRALEKPEEARGIISNVTTTGMEPAHATIYLPTYNENPDLRVGMLAGSLSEYLDRFIAAKEKGKGEE